MISHEKLAMEFNTWKATARPGSIFTYYHGNLALDRCNPVDGFDVLDCTTASLALDDLARTVAEAYGLGLVHLFQRKISEGVYDYIAMKRFR